MLREILKNSVIYRPWPVVVGDDIFPGQHFTFPDCCSRACFTSSNGRNYHRCAHGFDYYQRTINDENVFIGGVFFDHSAMPRQYKGLTKRRRYSNHDIDRWTSNINKLIVEAKSSQALTFSQTMRPLHEISRWANQVHAISNRIVSKYRKADLADNFKEATGDEKALLKSAQMLVDSFESLSIYFNPASAGYGKRRPTDVYRLIHKIILILEHAEGAAYNKKIRIEGSSVKKYDLYESFKIIPLSIIQNAIKYSSQRDIIVDFEESARGLLISITSTGLNIAESDIAKIFENGYRGKLAAQTHHEGMGIGLYTSKIVADANKIKLDAKCKSLDTKVSGSPQGVSTFSIFIPVL